MLKSFVYLNAKWNKYETSKEWKRSWLIKLESISFVERQLLTWTWTKELVGSKNDGQQIAW